MKNYIIKREKKFRLRHGNKSDYKKVQFQMGMQRNYKMKSSVTLLGETH